MLVQLDDALVDVPVCMSEFRCLNTLAIGHPLVVSADSGG